MTVCSFRSNTPITRSNAVTAPVQQGADVELQFPHEVIAPRLINLKGKKKTKCLLSVGYRRPFPSKKKGIRKDLILHHEEVVIGESL